MYTSRYFHNLTADNAIALKATASHYEAQAIRDLLSQHLMRETGLTTSISVRVESLKGSTAYTKVMHSSDFVFLIFFSSGPRLPNIHLHDWNPLLRVEEEHQDSAYSTR